MATCPPDRRRQQAELADTEQLGASFVDASGGTASPQVGALLSFDALAFCFQGVGAALNVSYLVL